MNTKTFRYLVRSLFVVVVCCGTLLLLLPTFLHTYITFSVHFNQALFKGSVVINIANDLNSSKRRYIGVINEPPLGPLEGIDRSIHKVKPNVNTFVNTNKTIVDTKDEEDEEDDEDDEDDEDEEDDEDNEADTPRTSPPFSFVRERDRDRESDRERDRRVSVEGRVDDRVEGGMVSNLA